jgi:hypothetical protein
VKFQDIQHMAKTDFNKAYQQGLFKGILSIARRDNGDLLSFNDVLKYIDVQNEFYKGIQYVKIDEIIGSEGRYNDFDKEFLPRRKNLRHRWERIDEAHYRDIILPPVELYKLGSAYFVRDGNHRVSVARRQGREFIDAEVIEIKSDINIVPGMTKQSLIDIVIKHEKENFLTATSLDRHRDCSSLTFSVPGRFDDLVSHIHGHQYYLGIEQNREVQFDEAVLSWYDNLFAPITDEIRHNKLTTRFPNRTEADLYVWIIRHWDLLKEKYGQSIPISSAVKSFNAKFGKSPMQLLAQLIKRIFIDKKTEK